MTGKRGLVGLRLTAFNPGFGQAPELMLVAFNAFGIRDVEQLREIL
jgi:hypothetical protein